MIAAANIELASQKPWMTRGADKQSQAARQRPEAFSDSIITAAKSDVEPDAAEYSGARTARRQKPAVHDAKTPNAVRESNALIAIGTLPQVVPQQVILMQSVTSVGSAITSTDDSAGGFRSSPALPIVSSSAMSDNGAQAVEAPVVAGAPSSSEATISPVVTGAIDAPGAKPLLHTIPDITANSSVSSPNQTALPATNPNETIGASNLSAATLDQVASLIQARTGSTNQPAVSNVGPTTSGKSATTTTIHAKAGSKDSLKDSLGLKQPVKPTAIQTEAQTGAQDATPGDQSQRDNSSQTQNSSPVPIVPIHSAGQNAVNILPMQPAVSLVAPVNHAAKLTDTATPTPVAVLQPLPIINTAKLIQSIGQTEMRVGMRSAEFGNISIHTSATPNSISAQISLDHSDLAKVLATHLPEIQAKLGNGQAVNVQLDLSGQSSGTHGGTSNGSADDSRSAQQQAGGETSSRPNNFGSENSRRFTPAIATMTTNNSRLSARLDIRV